MIKIITGGAMLSSAKIFSYLCTYLYIWISLFISELIRSNCKIDSLFLHQPTRICGGSLSGSPHFIILSVGTRTLKKIMSVQWPLCMLCNILSLTNSTGLRDHMMFLFIQDCPCVDWHSHFIRGSGITCWFRVSLVLSDHLYSKCISLLLLILSLLFS